MSLRPQFYPSPDMGQIEARPCVLFKRDLRIHVPRPSAYRLRNGDAKSDQINRFPCVFVISARQAWTALPYLSVRHRSRSVRLLRDTVDPHVYLEDYELNPTLPAAQRHIAWAFSGKPPVISKAISSPVSSKACTSGSQSDEVG